MKAFWNPISLLYMFYLFFFVWLLLHGPIYIKRWITEIPRKHYRTFSVLGFPSNRSNLTDACGLCPNVDLLLFMVSHIHGTWAVSSKAKKKKAIWVCNHYSMAQFTSRQNSMRKQTNSVSITLKENTCPQRELLEHKQGKLICDFSYISDDECSVVASIVPASARWRYSWPRCWGFRVAGTGWELWRFNFWRRQLDISWWLVKCTYYIQVFLRCFIFTRIWYG